MLVLYINTKLFKGLPEFDRASVPTETVWFLLCEAGAFLDTVLGSQNKPDEYRIKNLDILRGSLSYNYPFSVTIVP